MCYYYFCRSIMAVASNIDTDYKQVVLAFLISSTVITRYNHKTYSIDDIDFSMTPLSKFKYRDTEVCLLNY